VKEQKPQIIHARHIDPGIEKYKGTSDVEIDKLCQMAGLNYTSFIFADGRALLVLPNKTGGVLYPDKETLMNSLNLT
jgi:hypothetical protein